MTDDKQLDKFKLLVELPLIDYHGNKDAVSYYRAIKKERIRRKE